MGETVIFGAWLKRRRRLLDLTQRELAQLANCSVGTIRKIEVNERRPSKQLAELLAKSLDITPAQREAFVSFARTKPYSDEALSLPDVFGVLDQESPLPLLQTSFVSNSHLDEHKKEPKVPHNLPVQSTPFIGREAEIAELEILVNSPEGRLVTIVGPGGMGKTRLALAYAERQLAAAPPLSEAAAPGSSGHRDGIFFVDLAPLDAVEQIVPALAQAVGFPLRGGGDEQRSPERQIVDYLRSRSMLLLFDNFEHLLDGAKLLSAIVKRARNARLLVTSRERLQLHSENLFAIRGLEFPDWETPEDAAEYTAVRLFVQSARRVRRGFELQAEDIRFLGRICRQVEGMPLAVELAAVWVDLLSLEEIAAEIAAGLDLLETETRDVPRRQRSLRAVFDYSWQRLSQIEKQVLAYFSTFRGGCTREAAQMVTGASLRMLAVLSNKSLIQYRRRSTRYQIHALLRQYAAERLALDPAGEADALHKHSAFYCAELAAREEGLRRGRQQAAIEAIVTDFDNIRAAWEHAVVTANVADLTLAANGLGEFFEATGRWSEGEALFRRAAEHLGTIANEVLPRAATLLLVTLTARHVCLNFHRILQQAQYQEDQVRLLRDSLALLDGLASSGIESRAEEAFLRLQLGRVLKYGNHQQREEGCRQMEACLRLYGELRDDLGTSDGLYELAWSAWYDGRGDTERAMELLRESLSLLRSQGGSSWRLVRVLTGIGYLDMRIGAYGDAAEIREQAVGVAQSSGHRLGLGMVLRAFDSQMVHTGRYEEALALTDDYLIIYDELGSGDEVAEAYANAAFPSLYLGRYREARSRAQKGYDYGLEAGAEVAVAWSVMVLGWVSLSEQAYSEAWRQLTDCAARCRKLGDDVNVAQALASQGYAARGLGRQQQAQHHLAEALTIAISFRGGEGFLPLVLALPGVALLLADHQENERAIEVFALAKTHPMVGNSKWFDDIAGRQISSVAAALSAKVAAAAEARGRALDYWDTAVELAAELEGTVDHSPFSFDAH